MFKVGDRVQIVRSLSPKFNGYEGKIVDLKSGHATIDVGFTTLRFDCHKLDPVDKPEDYAFDV